jgi:type VI protein secretion system component VasF
MCCMKFNRHRRAILQQFERRLSDQLEQLQELPARVGSEVDKAIQGRSTSRVAMTAAWVTGAVAVLAAGLYAGRELRSRYKFKRRTPYDYYAHSGDRSDLEFGVGI